MIVVLEVWGQDDSFVEQESWGLAVWKRISDLLGGRCLRDRCGSRRIPDGDILNAGVAQGQSIGLPSRLCGFDSHRPLCL